MKWQLAIYVVMVILLISQVCAGWVRPPSNSSSSGSCSCPSESDPIFQVYAPSLANQSWVSDSNISIWSALNLKTTTSAVHSLLSTYLNLTMFQLSNNTQDTRLDNLETTNSTYTVHIGDANQVKVSCLNITGGSDGDYCTDATGGSSATVTDWTAIQNTPSNTYKGVVLKNHTSLNHTLYAKNLYRFEADIFARSNDTTNGLRIGLWYPTSNQASAKVYIPVSQADGTDAELIGFITTSGDNATGTGTTAVGNVIHAQLYGMINVTTTGMLQIAYANELATCNITILAGSRLTIYNETAQPISGGGK